MNLTRRLSPTTSVAWLLGLSLFTGIVVYMAWNAGVLGSLIFSEDAARLAAAGG